MYWTSDSIKLFRQDLENLVDLLGKIVPSSTTVLSGEDGRTYESFDDMKTREGAYVTTLYLSNREAGLEINLIRARHAVVTLSTMKGSKEAELAFYKAQEFLSAHKRRSAEFVGNLSLVGWIGASVFTMESFRTHTTRGEIIILIGWLISFLFLGVANLFGKRRAYFVTLNRRHEHLPFFARKKDDLIMFGIGSLASFTLGVLGTLIVQHFTKK